MAEQVKEKELLQSNWTEPSQDSLASIVLEIEKIPQEHWSNLLQIIRLFRESVINKTPSANTTSEVISQLTNLDPVVKAARQQALSQLLETWASKGDEQEQKETWAILSQALGVNDNSIST
ncbi:hypothetical protein NIES4071_89620 [Calothrix sp. NIES-4071]|nr:hypothetical protein NIES4071_89620 [Calothrix sp. NIES-4071]BAZ63229.1 hypothetical protein NIES4105_89550 [Calothrix sp. NIES-4105]